MAKARGRVAKTASTSNDIDVAPAKKSRTSAITELQLPAMPKLSGNVLVCGQNDVGQLGFSDDVPEKTRPALLPAVKDVVDIKAGGMHSLCLTSNGEIFSFGCNDEGALGRDTSVEGSEALPAKIDLPAKVIKISAGDSHSACLLEDGRAFAWGSFRDSHGSMGLTLEGNKKAPVEVLKSITSVDIASGADHLVILTSKGSVYTIGCGEQGQLGRLSVRTATGESRRGKSSLLLPDLINKKRGNFKADAIWATTYCTLLREQATSLVYAFGLNNYNQLAISKKTTETLLHPTLTTFENVKKIAGGQHHTLMLTNDNKCYSIGRKEYGRLGLGEVENDVVELTLIPSLIDKKIVDICCGEMSSFAMTADGKVYSFGMGASSLGTGDDDDVLIPKLIIGAQVKDKILIKVASGGQHSLFVVQAAPVLPEPVKEKSKKTIAKPVSTTQMDTDEGVVTSTSEIDTNSKPAPKKTKAKSDPKPKVNGESDLLEVASSSGKSEDTTKSKGRKK